MQDSAFANWTSLDTRDSIWRHFFTVSPLVVIGTREYEHYDLAPKHMVTPLGQENFFGFVCTPEHSTYHNVLREREFTVSFIKPNQVVMASLAATPRCEDSKNGKAIVQALPTRMATSVDAPFVRDSYLLLECGLDRIIDDFGTYSLIAGKILHAHVHRDALRTSEMDEAQMHMTSPILAYLAYGRFAEIRETRAFPFPRNFEDRVLTGK